MLAICPSQLSGQGCGILKILKSLSKPSGGCTSRPINHDNHSLGNNQWAIILLDTQFGNIQVYIFYNTYRMSFTLPYDSDCLNIEYLKSKFNDYFL